MFWEFFSKPKHVLAIKTNKLFGENKEGYFQGFIPKRSNSFEDSIIELGEFLLKKEKSSEQKTPLDFDSSYKQIIPYAVIKKKDKYLITEHKDKFSLGIGKNIYPIKMYQINKVLREEKDREFSVLDYGLMKNMNASIKEMDDYFDYKIKGFINIEQGIRNKEFGILYLVKLDENVDRKFTGKFFDKNEILENLDKFDEWSHIIWKQIMLRNL